MLESDTTVSIIIPNYNYSRYIGEAIESALRQSKPPLEIIVVDDGSSDDSVDKIKQYPVKLIEQKHEGVIAAKNIGCSIAKGSFILFLDADDILRKDALKEYLAAYEKDKEAAFYYSDMNYFGTINGRYKSIRFNKKVLRELNYIHNSALLKREAFLMAGGYHLSMARGYEDWDLYLSFAEMGFRGVYIPKILLDYRQHNDNSRNQMDNETKGQVILTLYNRHKKICPLWFRIGKTLYYKAYYGNMDDKGIFSRMFFCSMRTLFDVMKFLKTTVLVKLIVTEENIIDPKRERHIINIK